MDTYEKPPFYNSSGADLEQKIGTVDYQSAVLLRSDYS